jgi:hypothetical protein
MELSPEEYTHSCRNGTGICQPVLLDEVFKLDSCPIRMLYEGGQLSSGQFTIDIHNAFILGMGDSYV